MTRYAQNRTYRITRSVTFETMIEADSATAALSAVATADRHQGDQAIDSSIIRIERIEGDGRPLQVDPDDEPSPAWDHALSRPEGWSIHLTWDGERCAIEAETDASGAPICFPTDEAAVRFVLQQASYGSAVHLMALDYMRSHRPRNSAASILTMLETEEETRARTLRNGLLAVVALLAGRAGTRLAEPGGETLTEAQLVRQVHEAIVSGRMSVQRVGYELGASVGDVHALCAAHGYM